MSTLHTLVQRATWQEEVKKSRFIAIAQSVQTPQQAMDFFAEVAVPEARHNCWAYRIGQHYRFNDDGEPGGTAGRPILQAIDGQQCDQVAVLVVRWFGGILLGAGGLMRAYGGCAANALRTAEKMPLLDWAEACFECTFSELSSVQAKLKSLGARIQAEDYTASGALLRFQVLKEDGGALAAWCQDLSRGQRLLQFAEKPD